MKKKRKNMVIIIISIVIVLLITGGIYAYLTDTDQKTNVFTQGSVKISITEPNWNQTNGQDIRPGNVINKDPQINNIGKNDAYVYMRVEQPLVEQMTGANGPLFSYTANSGWTLLKSEECANPPKVISIYYYNTALAKNTSTTKLFNNVTVQNFGQNAAISGIKDMEITGYAIQTRNLPNGTTIANAYDTYFANAENNSCNSKAIYRWSTSQWGFQQDISSFTEGTDYVTNKLELTNMNTLANKFYLKYYIDNENKVSNNFICFIVSPTLVQTNPGMKVGDYCIEMSDNKYASNAKTIYEAFGSYCSTNPYTEALPQYYFTCTATGLEVSTSRSWNHTAKDSNGNKCFYYEDGITWCEEH